MQRGRAEDSALPSSPFLCIPQYILQGLMDSPSLAGAYQPPPQEKTITIEGEPRGDRNSAIESAYDAVVRHLVGEYGIIIDDWNYSAMVGYKEKMVVAQQEFSRKIAEFKALQKEVVREKQQLDGLAEKLKDVCIESAGFLPVRAGGPCGVEYVGRPSPTGGFDELALDLVQLLQPAEYDE
ncbi:unnamed protein product [Alopecurus aequalis]